MKPQAVEMKFGMKEDRTSYESSSKCMIEPGIDRSGESVRLKKSEGSPRC